MSDLPTPTGMSQKDKNELVTSFLAVRRFIGFIGLALPVLLILYTFLAESSGPKDSISAYFLFRWSRDTLSAASLPSVFSSMPTRGSTKTSASPPTNLSRAPRPFSPSAWRSSR